MVLRKFRTNIWLLILGLLLSGVVHAEGNCPEGYYPIGAEPGQSGPQGCAPIPGHNQTPRTQWATQWGAIVTDADKGILGEAANVTSQDQAEQTAMADCRAKGGTQCKLQLAYHNQCAAMVLGDKAFNVSSAATADLAAQSGIKRCSADSANCHVYYSACSLPKRIQ